MKSYKWITSFVLSAAVIFAGCSAKSGPQNKESTIRIGTVHRIRSGNPLYDYSLGIFTMISNPPLLRLSNDGGIKGLLADSYSFSPDYSRWKFMIGKNYYWSDGVPVTPGDVTFSMAYLAEHVPSRRWLRKVLLQAGVTEDHGVTFTFNKPYTRLDMEFTSVQIFPKHIWEKVRNPKYNKDDTMAQYTGCGPFVISSIDLNAGLVSMNRNPYWQGKEPALDRIEIHMYRNLDVLSLALEKGHVDSFYKYADSYPYANIDRLRRTGNFDFLETPGTGLTFLGFNLRKKPLSDIAFRRAAAYAIDYGEIVKLTGFGYGETPGKGFVTPDMMYYKESEKLKQDINKGRDMLRQAGYQDQKGVLLLLSTSPYVRLCELVKSYLSRLGIPVEVKIVDNATWVTMKDRCDYDITISRTTPWGMRAHANWGTGYFDSRRSGEGVLHSVDDPAFLSLCDAVLATKEPAELERYAREIRDYYAEKLPAVALIWKKGVIPFHRGFEGWVVEPVYGIFNIENFLNLKRSHAPH